MQKKLLIATHNRSKYDTIRRYLQLLCIPYQICSLADLGITDDVEETGKTFEENACLKARWYHEKTGLPTIADDSGLEVNALGGQPGVHTKRFAGVDKTDEEHRIFMLNKLVNIPDEQRGARFVAVVAFANENGNIQTCRGEDRGSLTKEARGTPVVQFPFCSIFVPKSSLKTIAELYDEGKMLTCDHRIKALSELVRSCLQ